MSEPPLRLDSTTTTTSPSAARMRLRSGKRRAWGGVPGGASLSSSAPLDDLVPQRAVLGRVHDVEPAGHHPDGRTAARGRRARPGGPSRRCRAPAPTRPARRPGPARPRARRPRRDRAAWRYGCRRSRRAGRRGPRGRRGRTARVGATGRRPAPPGSRAPCSSTATPPRSGTGPGPSRIGGGDGAAGPLGLAHRRRTPRRGPTRRSPGPPSPRPMPQRATSGRAARQPRRPERAEPGERGGERLRGRSLVPGVTSLMPPSALAGTGRREGSAPGSPPGRRPDRPAAPRSPSVRATRRTRCRPRPVSRFVLELAAQQPRGRRRQRRELVETVRGDVGVEDAGPLVHDATGRARPVPRPRARLRGRPAEQLLDGGRCTRAAGRNGRATGPRCGAGSGAGRSRCRAQAGRGRHPHGHGLIAPTSRKRAGNSHAGLGPDHPDDALLERLAQPVEHVEWNSPISSRNSTPRGPEASPGRMAEVPPPTMATIDAV